MEGKKPIEKGQYLSIGMAIGLCIGVAMDNIPIGICIGVALVIIFIIFIYKDKSKQKSSKPACDTVFEKDDEEAQSEATDE